MLDYDKINLDNIFDEKLIILNSNIYSYNKRNPNDTHAVYIKKNPETKILKDYFIKRYSVIQDTVSVSKLGILRKEHSRGFGIDNLFIGTLAMLKEFLRSQPKHYCGRCEKDLPKGNFNKDLHHIRGRYIFCKKCVLKFSRTPEGIVNAIYFKQIHNSKKRNHLPPEYNRFELRSWIINNPTFDEMYGVWVKSDYCKNLKPSIDRLDVTIGYTYKNIELVTWEENTKREISRISIPIHQFDLDKKLIKRYPSLDEAEKMNKYPLSSLTRLLRDKEVGEYIKYNNYLWAKYKED